MGTPSAVDVYWRKGIVIKTIIDIVEDTNVIK